MSAINAGELKHSLKIYTVGYDLDDEGRNIATKTQLYRLRCKRKTISTKEFISADKQTSSVTHKFICRNRDIDNTMVLEFKNNFYNIEHVHEIDEFFIEITASWQE